MSSTVTFVSFKVPGKRVRTAVVELAEGTDPENVTAQSLRVALAKSEGVAPDDVELRGRWRKRAQRGT
jgi:hypothetical protein